MDEIVRRLELVRERVEKAARRAGRRAEDIKLIAVTKTVEPERIMTAIRAGITDFGENRVQEAEAKIPALPASVWWHFVGHLQSNKARKAVMLFDSIHSVDSARLAERLDRISCELGKPMPVLIQVDLGGEPTKYGVNPDELIETAERMAVLKGIEVIGLMAIPPYRENPEHVRPLFRQLASMLQDLNKRNIYGRELTELSMGMSHDFEVAIEEGATTIRVGTAIFGERS